ncbi:nucleotide-binding universal stress UspA family protein [Nocardioides luteus]|uniref:universal stress protein n=1 Tax=Nocardioides luteus TaxID=1844 RepID=UPI00285FE279|nr:universal stress protein [Nocardioides luteus]MDR7311283.1 nucleotide-binding universal stress UspA family protein [Nocardioides luteus]
MTYEGIPTGTVLVGIENWPAAAESVSWAAEQAYRDGREVTLLHVMPATTLDTPPGFRAGAPSEPDQGFGAIVLSSAARYAERRIGELSRAKELDGLRRPKVTVELRAGSPAAVLAGASSRASLLVLGSRGRGPVGSRLLGSISRSVVEHAGCPVVVLCPGAGGVGRGVLVGVDGTSESLPALEFAFDQAAERHLPLTVLYCHEPDAPIQAVSHRLVVADSVAGLRDRYPDVQPRIRVQAGNPGRVLTEQAQTMHMVVIGGDGGAVARRLLGHAHSVVAIVPARTAQPGRHRRAGHFARAARGQGVVEEQTSRWMTQPLT